MLCYDTDQPPADSFGRAYRETRYQSGQVLEMDEQAPPNARRYFVNLALLVATGVVLTGWVLFYTDYFPVVGGLLGLGGLFAWIAFLGNVVSDARKSQLQQILDERFLQRPWAVLVPVGILLAFTLAFPLRYTTLVLDATAEDATRVVKISAREDGREMLVTRVRPGSEQKFLLPAGAEYLVSVTERPSFRFLGPAFSRTVLSLPADLYTRPTLLIRPQAVSAMVFHASIRDASQAPFAIRVRAGDHDGGCQEYRGEAIWIGAQDGMLLASGIQDRWRIDFDGADIEPEAFLRSWSRPSKVDWAALSGAKVHVEVYQDRSACEGEVLLACWTRHLPADTTEANYFSEVAISAMSGPESCQ